MTLEEAWRWSNEENKCSANKLCGFDPTFENDEILIEHCRFCNKRLMFNKVDGRIDNKRYLRAHTRDTLQPNGITGRLFREIYGVSPINKVNEIKKIKGNRKTEDDWIAEARDTYKTVKKLSPWQLEEEYRKIHAHAH